MRFILFFSAVLFTLGLRAQDTTFTSGLIPLSPEAAAFGKATTMPMTMYEGIPNVSIPIYDLKTTKLDLPISLTYNRNGDRPNEAAPWVGLGWSVSVGGIITREVQGQVDDNSFMQLFTSSSGNNGNSHQYNDWEDFPDPTLIANCSSNIEDYLTNVYSSYTDGQPDIYMFSAGGYSGKFILVQGRAYVFPAQDIQITYGSGGFTMIAPDGAKFTFGALETTYSTGPYGQNRIPSFSSAWHLTEILAPDKSDSITIAYGNGYRSARPNGAQQIFTNYSGGNGDAPNNSFQGNMFTSQGTNIATLLVSDIYSSNAHIHFTQSTTRQRKDFLSAALLSSIQVYTQTGQLLKNDQLCYSYFGDSTQYLKCKLRLDSVVMFGSDSLVRLPYKFSYTTQSVSYIGTLGFDMWGYANGMDNNVDLFDCTKLTSLLSMNGFPGCSSRQSNNSYASQGLLSSIRYPTGGHVSFNYEQNYYRSPTDPILYNQLYLPFSLSDTSHPGAPLNKTVSQSFTIQQAQVISLTAYRQGNLVTDKSVIGAVYDSNGSRVFIGVNFGTSSNSSLASQTDTFTLQPGRYTVYTTSDGTNDTLTSVNFTYYQQGSIIEGTIGPGMRVSQISYFLTDTSSSPSQYTQYQYTNAAGLSTGQAINVPTYGQIISNYAGSFSSDDGSLPPGNAYQMTQYTSSYNASTEPLVTQQFWYGQVTEINHDVAGAGENQYGFLMLAGDMTSVTLVSKNSFVYVNGQLRPVATQLYNYYDTVLASFGGVNQVNLNSWASYTVEPSSPGIQYSPVDSSVLTRYSYYTGSNVYFPLYWQRLASTDEYLYDTSGVNATRRHTNFYYQSPNHFEVTQKVESTSDGDSLVTNYKYPLDYPYLANPSIRSSDSLFLANRVNLMNAYLSCDLNRSQLGEADEDSAALETSRASYWYNQVTVVERTHPCENWYCTYYQQANHTRDSTIAAYQSALALAIASPSLPITEKGILQMQLNNIVDKPVEQSVSLWHNGVESLLKAIKSEYLVNGLGSVYLDSVWSTELAAPISPATFSANTTSYYKPEDSYAFDSFGNLSTENKVSDYTKAYLWDYNHTYCIAETDNAALSDVAYTSFEADGTGGWVVPDTTRNRTVAITGNNAYHLNGANTITKTGLNASLTYVIGYWQDSSNSITVNGSPGTAKLTLGTWTYYEDTVHGVSSVSVSGTGTIDELRLFPKGAFMETYTISPLIGMTAESTPSGRLMFYTYDNMGRLKLVKDQYGNILKRYDYQYQVSINQ